jgi:uncharacterized membrane protein
MTTQITEKTDQRMDLIMSRLLRTGVLLSAMLVLAGGALYLLRHPTPVTDYHNFQGEPAEFRTVPGIFHEVLALRGRGLIQFGLLLLIATPIARVVFSVFAFLSQRDWAYVVVTLMVLAILFYSLLGQHP